MAFNFRNVLPTDAEAIATLKRVVWPEEESVPLLIAQTVLDSHHSGAVVYKDHELVGFVDGFLSVSLAGERRWEVDLLAIHPEFRGVRIGERLVQASNQAGREMGARSSRALIRLSNIASQRTFQRCNFHPDGAIQRLYVGAAGKNSANAPEELPGGLIPVKTYNYQGVWLEGAVTPDLITNGRAFCASNGLEVMGAVIAEDQQHSISAVEQADFHLVGQYQWWVNWL